MADDITKVQMGQWWTGTYNKPAFERAAEDQRVFQTGMAFFGRLGIIGDPNGAVVPRVKAAGTKILRLDRKPQDIVDHPNAIAGGRRKAHIRTGNAMSWRGGPGRAHRPPTRTASR